MSSGSENPVANKQLDDAHLTIEELSQRSHLSVATINRLKKAGLIPFFQPGGPNTSVRFPPDAIEQACANRLGGLCQHPAASTAHAPKKLSGPIPKWKQPPKPNP
jgi:hypothetical protein